ncbi:MAG: methyltransferase domain-containing protein [Treponema sp.]|nr:methyltransferase domain-containing protein [Treponema sp.]MBR1537116.1 methyltransferase domain-containing protein [Treponema sp.]
MELYENIAEYYDELYPASDELKKFYEDETKAFTPPVKYLSIGCGTGSFEHYLAKKGCDVTGLETVPSLIESANRKRRTQLMALRFFQMSSLEMCRFLGKGFYNVIMIPDNRIIFTHDSTLMAKLFYDCRLLLAEGGKLILHLPNFEKFNAEPVAKLPIRESIRVRLFSKIKTDSSGKKFFEQELETGTGKRLFVTKDAEIQGLTKDKIEQYAKEVGFTKFSFYSDFAKSEFTKQSNELIVVLS